MKTLKIKHNIRATYFILTLLTLTTACDLEEANVNPQASSTAPRSSVLSSAEVALSFTVGINAILPNTWVQQFSGANGDAAPNDNYRINATYFNSVWDGLYVNVLQELEIIKKAGAADNSPYYIGIAKVLNAYTYGTLTDLFGDIPLTDALKGQEVRNPHYDSQELVYAYINQELDEAIIELSKPLSSFTTVAPGNDDVIYKGNIANWLAAAYTLKARYALHLSKVDKVKAATQALAALYKGATYRGIAANSSDLQLVFGAATTNANPFWQQQTFRPNWVALGRSFVNLLNGNSVTDDPLKPETLPDPRRAAFATQSPANSGKYRGSVAGIPGAFSLIGPACAASTAPVILTSFVEAKFIEAEARLILDEQAAAQDALTQAITASFDKFAIAGDTNATAPKRAAYLAAKATLTGDFDADLEAIITQKYIALFTNPEVFTDYRRTGYPAHIPAVGGTTANNPNGLIPRRVPYPVGEKALNPNTPEANYQTPRLWWDVD